MINESNKTNRYINTMLCRDDGIFDEVMADFLNTLRTIPELPLAFGTCKTGVEVYTSGNRIGIDYYNLQSIRRMKNCILTQNSCSQFGITDVNDFIEKHMEMQFAFYRVFLNEICFYIIPVEYEYCDRVKFDTENKDIYLYSDKKISEHFIKNINNFISLYDIKKSFLFDTFEFGKIDLRSNDITCTSISVFDIPRTIVSNSVLCLPQEHISILLSILNNANKLIGCKFSYCRNDVVLTSPLSIYLKHNDKTKIKDEFSHLMYCILEERGRANEATKLSSLTSCNNILHRNMTNISLKEYNSKTNNTTGFRIIFEKNSTLQDIVRTFKQENNILVHRVFLENELVYYYKDFEINKNGNLWSVEVVSVLVNQDFESFFKHIIEVMEKNKYHVRQIVGIFS